MSSPSDPLSTRDVAELLGISTSALYSYRKAGVDITDLEAVKAERIRRGTNKMSKVDRHRAPPGEMSYDMARTRKMAAEAILAEQRLEVLLAETLPVARAIEEIDKIHRRLEIVLGPAADPLPADLVGEDETGIQKRIRVAIDEALLDLADPGVYT